MTSGYWFSLNQDKAWTEKFFLGFIPVFFLYNAIMQKMGWVDTNTFWHIVQNLAMWLPYCVFLPFYLRRHSGIPWHQSYWFKANLFMFWWTFIVTYVHTEYFFDVLGMRYNFPQVHSYFDSALIGPSETSALAEHKKVPLGMYFNTVAFFIVYHNAAVIFIRRIYSTTEDWARSKRLLVWIATIAITAVFWAWAETRLYINDDVAGTVWYENLDQMLLYGSLFYSLYFIVSFPAYFRLDEEDERWSWGRILMEASAIGMISMLLIDFAAQIMEPLA